MRRALLTIGLICFICTLAYAGGRTIGTVYPSNTTPVVIVDPDGNYGGIANRAGNYGQFTVGLDFPHYKTHLGEHYVAQYSQELAIGQKILLLVNTPASGRMHIIIPVTTSGEAYYELWRSPTVSAIGNALSINNRDDALNGNTDAEISFAPTVTDAGTELTGLGGHLGAGQKVGGESFSFNEIIFRANTLYLINTVSEANNNHVTVITDFYTVGGN